MSVRNMNVKGKLDMSPVEVKNSRSRGAIEPDACDDDSRVFDGTISSIHGDDDISAYR